MLSGVGYLVSGISGVWYLVSGISGVWYLVSGDWRNRGEQSMITRVSGYNTVSEGLAVGRPSWSVW